MIAHVLQNKFLCKEKKNPKTFYFLYFKVINIPKVCKTQPDYVLQFVSGAEDTLLIPKTLIQALVVGFFSVNFMNMNGLLITKMGTLQELW